MNLDHLGSMPERWSEAEETNWEVEAQDEDGDQDKGEAVVARHPLGPSHDIWGV